MGLYATPERLYMSSRYQLWQFDNVLASGQLDNGYDKLYVPRIAYTTGEIAHWLRIEGVLAGVQRAKALGFKTDQIQHLITIENDKSGTTTYKKIRLLKKENGGISDARNAGIAIANGEYIPLAMEQTSPCVVVHIKDLVWLIHVLLVWIIIVYQIFLSLIGQSFMVAPFLYLHLNMS